MVTIENSFTERGLCVDLVLSTATGTYLSEVSPAVNLVDLGRSRVLTSLRGLVGYLRTKKPAVLLSAMGHANFVALLARRLARVRTRIVVSERNDLSVENVSQQYFRLRLINYLNRRYYRYADVVHAVSGGVADAVASQFCLPRQKIAVIYNPVVTKKLLELSQESANYSWLSTHSRPLIVAAGRLTNQKNFSLLIRAFSLVREKIDAHLAIMGEGELRTDLEHLISSLALDAYVALPGFIDNPFAVMKKADLFVLSSSWEGLPNVLIQAMACGTAVISTDCPSGPAEILENGKWGRLVPVGDVEALAGAMLDSLVETRHPDVAQRAAYFSVNRATEEYLRLLFPGVMK
jgi:glycosyltransferase involved in cell wall biosynthesis